MTSAASALMPTSLDSAMRLAEMMAKGKLVPQPLQGQPADCLMVIEQATRWNMSPFAVAQCASVIQGKLMFEGKLVAAAIQSSGILDGRLDYRFEGEGNNRKVTCIGKIRGVAEPKEASVTMSDVKTNNQMWQKQPDQQLVYSVSRLWGRRWAPEVMLGVYAPEEFNPPAEQAQQQREVIDLKAEPVPVWSTINPSGKTVQAKNVNEWVKWCTAFIAKLESAEAVGTWRDAMQPHFAALDSVEAKAVEHVQGLAQDRIDSFSDEPAEVEA